MTNILRKKYVENAINKVFKIHLGVNLTKEIKKKIRDINIKTLKTEIK